MALADFIHLRVHSAYSLSEGAIKMDKIPLLARENAMPAVALTDSSNMFGALEFSLACKARGIQPILGCQIALARADAPRLAPDPLVLLARNPAGFANLQRLASKSFIETEAGLRPQIQLDVLCSHADGLFLLTGGTTGPIARLLAEGQRDEAAALLARLNESFPGYLAVELHRHGLAIERAIEPGLVGLADRARLPIVATNDCMFAARSMFQAHDALLCIAEGRVIAEPERRRVTEEHWFKPASMMRARFADLPDACDNSIAIAQICAAMAETRKPLLPISPKVRAGMSEADTMREMAREGLARRLDFMQADAESAKPYQERLEFELNVIADMGFSGYFMIVADFIQWARGQGIPVGPGRGSGAGSVVAWALTITDLDPIRFSLLFERFLNPERVSMPDFDIDFCQERRDEVIDYVRREYGADRVAQIITFGKLQARAAVRDVGRVLAMPYGQVNKVAELIPNIPAKPLTLQQAIDGEKRLQDLRDSDESIARLLEIALQLEGLYRHASTHAAGVVIGDRPLIDLVPLYRDAKSDFLVTQYSMKYVESAGLVKFDFLGLTTLTILDRALKFLKSEGIEVDLERIPLDDKPTYEMLDRGDVAGVFQFESQGMRDLLRQMHPYRFEDLIATVALFRPGPMENIPAYLQRRNGGKWELPHPATADILTDTYGIMIYQEQVMQIAQKLAGYSLAGADLLRRAMGKKIRSEMDQQRKIFTDGAIANDIDLITAGEIFDLMAKFADYGFNKSHAAAYALVSYQTAWMKCHHPVAFIAACMSLAISDTDKLATLRQEAARLNISVLPPDINSSAADFALGHDKAGNLAIRYALAAIKRVGRAAMEQLVAARGARPFANLADMATRIDPRALNKSQIENLAKAGAFDQLMGNRAQMFTGAETLLRRAQAEAEQRASGQVSLFGDAGSPEPLPLPDMADWPPLERLGFEAEAIGFHLSAHPLDAYETALKRLHVVRSNTLEARAASGARVKLAGTVISRKERVAASGNKFAFLRLSDQAGTFEITLFSEILARTRDLLVEGNSVLATVDLRMEGESMRITTQDIVPLDQAAANTGGGIRIIIERADALAPLASLLAREGKGKGRIVLAPQLDAGRSMDLVLPGLFNVSPRLAQAMKLLPGVAMIQDL